MDNRVVLGASVGAALVVGGATGYLVARKQLTTKYEALAQQEIAEARDYYRTLHKKEGFATPEAAVAALIPEEAQEALRLYSGAVPAELSGQLKYHRAELLEGVGSLAVEAETVELSVFNQVEQEHDIEAEVRDRTEEAPYIISKDEFFADEAGHSQITVSYYLGDGVLADERDQPIEDIDATVGDDNIPRFGHRSEDPNILYVRNHRLGTDFEICLSKGKYAVEVAGLKEE